MGKWASYRKRGTAPNFPAVTPTPSDWTIAATGSDEATGQWVADDPPIGDRFVIKGDQAAGGDPHVSALLPFVDSAIFAGLNPDTYNWQISLWDSATTTQVSDWSEVKQTVQS